MIKENLIKNLLQLLFIEVLFEVGFINIVKIFNISSNLYTIFIEKTLFLILLVTLNRKLTKIHIQFSIQLDRHEINNLVMLIVMLFGIGIMHIDRILYAFVIGLVACLTEEYLMRGIVLTSLISIFQNFKNKYARILLPVMISSIFFGSEHLINLYSQNLSMTIVQVVMTTAMGFVLSGIFLRTTNLLYPMVCHFSLDYLIIIINGISENSNVSIYDVIFPTIFYLFVGFVIMLPIFDQNQNTIR